MTTLPHEIVEFEIDYKKEFWRLGIRNDRPSEKQKGLQAKMSRLRKI